MTIKEMALHLGTSVPTLYRKLKDAGIDIKALRDAEGRLTPAGAATIASLFDGPQASLKTSQDVLSAASQTISGDTSQYISDDTSMRIEMEVLKVKLESMETTVEMLTGELDRQRAEVDRLRDERDRLLTMLEAEQASRVRLLESGERHGRGLFSWWRRSPRDSK